MKKTRGARRIRIRWWLNGCDVVLALEPGTYLRWHWGEPTDEGYHWEAVEWTWDAERGLLNVKRHSGGRDCDGPHEWHDEAVLLIEDMPPIREVVGTDYRYDWQEVSEGCYQRDAFAEAAGY